MSTSWSLLSTHGAVLFYIAGNPESTHRQIARALNVTEKRVADVIRHLAQEDFICVHRAGRRNWYSLNRSAHFRSPPLANVCLDDVVRIIESEGRGTIEASEVAPVAVS